ncbi:ribosome hibernation factor-recruiting GTPase MRF [Actinophytocola gossypii]|uniref:GTP-binding protein n=1 Tax=Actinophytocola gossypii TaxID=2812003 RepID=A0ABT2JDQ2_9PSEU|nr:GTP-binding protein [Actinophytocola gossypii]MCT2585565.1 GTP-binding protein [Actinophytocola gossypii]
MGERVRLVVVAGLARDATGAVCDQLLHAAPGVEVVHHDLRGLRDGVVHRRTRTTTDESAKTLELAHGCVSCTLREDVLPLLARLARRAGTRRIVLHLDPAVEPEPVCAELATLADLVRVEAVLAVVDEGTWLADATSELCMDELAHRGLDVLPDDDRGLAQVAVNQVAFADAVVLTGRAEDRWTAARTAAVLDRLVPAAPRARPDTGHAVLALLADLPPTALRGRVEGAHAPLLRGAPPLEPDCGVVLTLFTDRRPFHPRRLYEAIDVLLDGVVHTRGRAWVASQPDVALWLESAGGGLRVGHAGTWLATAGDETWEQAGAERRTKAALDWHPRFGDRTQELVILSHDASPAAISAALRDALLTDEELAAGEATWRTFSDPFDDWRADAGTPVTDSRKDTA